MKKKLPLSYIDSIGMKLTTKLNVKIIYEFVKW